MHTSSSSRGNWLFKAALVAINAFLVPSSGAATNGVPAINTWATQERVLQKGAQGAEVERLYVYLKAFGYFPNPELERYPGWRPAVARAPTDPRRFDETLEQALRLFQRAHGLEVDGKLNPQTRALMQQARCGFPDEYGAQGQQGEVSAEFVPSGYKWPYNALTYRFLNYTPDLSVSTSRDAVRGAFDRWAAVSPLSFTETSTSGDILIGWYYGDHGDGTPFDGAGKVLAHAFYPTTGDAHFDEAERWTNNGTDFDFASVALHEFGHSLGLNHSSDTNAVMYAYYNGSRRNLAADDIMGIQSIYGLKAISWSSAGSIAGKYCVQIFEASDPHTWDDNYLCSNVDYGFKWSSAGPISGMRCTQIHEYSEPTEHTWTDNYLCVPTSSTLQLTWSSAGPIAGKTCTQWYEASDPHTWMDNYLCY